MATRYFVREAVLLESEGGRSWRITFAPQDGEGEAIVVAQLPSSKLSELSFVGTYSRTDIEALQD